MAVTCCEVGRDSGGRVPRTEQGKIEGLDFRGGGHAPKTPIDLPTCLCPPFPSRRKVCPKLRNILLSLAKIVKLWSKNAENPIMTSYDNLGNTGML